MIKILKRYVLKEVLAPFLLGIVFFTFVIMINQLFRESEVLIAYGVKWSVFSKLIFNLLPSILTFITPMAFLVAVLIGYGRLASDNEILAMRASGVSLGFIIRPMLLVALLVSLALMAFNWATLPKVNLRVIDTLYSLQFSALTNLQPGRFYDEFETSDIDLTLYFSTRTIDGEPEEHYPGSDQTLGGINLKVETTTDAYLQQQQAQQGGRPARTFRPATPETPAPADAAGAGAAQEASSSDPAPAEESETGNNKDIAGATEPEKGDEKEKDKETDKEKTEEGKDAKKDKEAPPKPAKDSAILVANRGKIEAITDEKSIRLTLLDGSLQMLNWSKPEENVIFHFNKFTKHFRPEIINTPDGQYVKGRKEMTVPELRRAMQDHSLKRSDRNLFRNEFYQRFSLPLSCLAFALLGIPMAIIFRPSSKAYGFALSFALIMVYFMMLKWGTSLGKEGHPLAPLAIFSPNLALGALGVALLMKARRL